MPKKFIKYRLIWFLIFCVLIALLTIGEIIGELDGKSLSQCYVDKDCINNLVNSFIKHASANLLKILEHAISFAVLVFVFGYFYMRDIKDAIKNGFGEIGETIASKTQPITDSAVESLRKLAEAAESHNKVFKKIDENHIIPILTSISKNIKTDPKVEDLVKEKEKIILELTNKGEFEKAENILSDFVQEHPKNIRVFESMFFFYEKNHREFSQQKILEKILLLEENFEEEPRYYRVLSTIYMWLKEDVLKNKSIMENAIKAANKCIFLEPDNPKWQTLLGYVSYVFGDINQSISSTEKALGMEEIKKDKDMSLIMHLKNNLAYYYADEKINKEKAFEYSQLIYRHYKVSREDSERAMGFDTAGYVRLKFATKEEDIKKSISFFTNAIKFYPERRIVSKHLQDAYLKLKEYTNVEQ